MMIRILALFCLLFSVGVILASCASMTKEECAVADWKSVGERDGAAGQGLDYFARNVDACKKTKARPDHAAWQEGHAIGARRYCTPENGLLAGNNGKNYNNICPIDLQAEFLSAYQLGQQRHGLLQEHRTKASLVASNKSTISDIDRKIPKVRSTSGMQPAKSVTCAGTIVSSNFRPMTCLMRLQFWTGVFGMKDLPHRQPRRRYTDGEINTGFHFDVDILCRRQDCMCDSTDCRQTRHGATDQVLVSLPPQKRAGRSMHGKPSQ